MVKRQPTEGLVLRKRKQGQQERAALVTENLLKMGYQNVRSLQGGLQSWLESGGELEVLDHFRNRNRRRI
jgi:3-mercaptopyruvate sulfurtransferase SseA